MKNDTSKKFFLNECDESAEGVLAESADIISISGHGDGTALNIKRGDNRGFIIEREENSCSITYGDIPGLCRALLYIETADGLPSRHEAECAFRDFGVMLDVSRNAVINISTLKSFIRLAAFMGYGFVGLYMEDTLAVAAEPYLGYMRGALLPEEIKEADSYAKKFGIELRPFIQTLAHLNQITRYEEYQRITDIDDILLAGEKRTEELIENILKTVAGCFSTRKINIGMDEAHHIGLGKYLDKHGYRERAGIMKGHLEKVLALCGKYGLSPQMWSDMFFRLACGGNYYIDESEVLPDIDIPEGVELVYWDYYSMDEAHYDRMIKQHQCFAQNIAFAGGAWKWTGFAPHNRYSIRTGRAAINACKKNGVSSFTITCWGDDGAEASVFSVLPALFADADEAYGAALPERAFKRLTGYTMEQFLKIDDTNPYQPEGEGHNNACKFLLYNDPLLGTFDSVVREDTAAHFGRAVTALEQLSQPSDGSGFSYIFRTQQCLCRVLEMKADLGKRIYALYRNGDRKGLSGIADELGILLQALEELYQALYYQWHAENKSFGFEVQSIRIGGLLRRLDDVAVKLRDYAEGRIQIIEELEAERRPFAYFENNDIKTLNFNLWAVAVSPSRL